MPTHRSYNRKLAKIRRITAVEEVTKRFGAVRIDGWKALVLNDENFMPNELVLFCEVDLFVPHRNPYSKQFARWGTLQAMDGEEGWRIATQKLVYHRDSEKLKVTSQGRVFHLKHFPTIVRDFRALKLEAPTSGEASMEAFIRNTDFVDTLGIKKWESLARWSGPDPQQNPKTPSFIASAKMDRLQNCPNLFLKPKYKRYTYQQTVKLDGSAITVYFVNKDCRLFEQLPLLNNNTLALYRDSCIFDSGRVGICSSSKDIIYSVQSAQQFIDTATGLQLSKLLFKLGLNIAIQGELVGFNTRGNPYGYTNLLKKGKGKDGEDKLDDFGNGYDFFVYAIVDIDSGKRWNPKAVSKFTEE
ncbi:hypothetical protein QBC36DRAFT_200941 [Triangularia setosa]|uniref:RNA ligase domain-containing protein n=1 Tax=Triangularia setosa TaxID=2587417 RepID=A0AAN6VYY3_9PEZI|nr:hypothetical protein QBC36DRAFT_200941 [Podospora setosa]